MADMTVERLVAVLEARVDKYEKAFQKARATSDRELAAVEGRGTAFAANMNAAMGRAAQGFDATSKNVVALKGQTANLASQFQDIAVQLQSGSSPLTIALQQGTQISAALGPLGAGAAVKALGGAFLSLLSPVSLATIAIISLGGALVQWLTTGSDKVKDFSAELAEADAAIRNLKAATDIYSGEGLQGLIAKYGEINTELLIHIERMNEIARMDSLKQFSDAIQAIRDDMTSGWIVTDVDAVRNAFQTTNDQARYMLGLIEQIRSANTFEEQASAVEALRTAINDATGGFENATGAAQDLSAKVEQAYGRVLELRNAAPAENWMDAAINGVSALVGRLWDAVGAQAALTQARLADASIQPSGQRGDPRQFSTDKFYNDMYFPSPEQAAPRAAGRRGGGGGRGGKSEETRERERAAEAVKRERDAVKDLIDNLVFEASLVGKTKEEKAAANAVRRAGAAATNEERQFIELATIALEQQKDAIEANKQAMQDMQDMAKGFLNDFFSGIEQGKGVWESFGDAALNVLNKITDKLLDDVLNAIFDVNGALGSGGGGGFLSSILGGLFGGGGLAGARANGGPVSSGRPYLVGERGPEIIVPRHAATVMPNKALGGGGSSQTNVTYHIDARGAQKGVGEEIRKALEEYDRMVAPKTAVNSVQRAQRYGVMK